MFAKHANQTELGYIKVRFFDSITIFKPSVTLLLFDWQDLPLGTFDWLACEKTILDELKNYQDSCQVAAKDTKIIILIFMPLNEQVNADECRNSLKNQLRQKNPDDIQTQQNSVKHIMMIQNGINGLQSNPKDLAKKMFEHCHSYYMNKKRDIKAKQKKLIKDQLEHIRYQFKIAVYSQLSKGDVQSSLKHYR